MKKNVIKVVDAFVINGRGIVCELQHYLNGLPSETLLKDPNSEDFWVVKKRILSGILMLDDTETYFDCETELDHLSIRFATKEKHKAAIDKALQKRKNGIYCYLLKPHPKNQNEKPISGIKLNIKQ